MNNILPAVLTLSFMGLTLGSLLAFASIYFKVDEDERVPKIIEALPGANCGGCGYSGCAAFANAIVEKDAPLNGCPVGGSDTAKKIAEIMGAKAVETEKSVAMVMCKGEKDVIKTKYQYFGIEDCIAAEKLAGGPNSCTYGCIGYGTCAKVCPFDAIDMINGIAAINKEKCTACGKCIDICPKNIIKMVPYESKVWVNCSSKDKGVVTKNNCKVGCIACRLCERACMYDAIKVIDNVAVIDQSKCTACGKCVIKCPKGIIKTELVLNDKKLAI
jgi:electron transport complex protein RnfB